MIDCLAVGVGGFVGSVARYLAGKIPVPNPAAFPINTLLINIAGSFVIGCLAALASRNAPIHPRLMLFLKVGICGGFTTFSTFSLETSELIRSGAYTAAVLYVLLSAGLGILVVILAQNLILQ